MRSPRTLRAATSSVALLLCASFALAQEPCATMAHHHDQLQNDPNYAAAHAAVETQTQAFVAQWSGQTGDTIITIPVVVHLVYATAQQNLSDQQVQSQLAILNEDFRRLNADAAQTRAIFQGVAADCEIEFCLASRDPQGNPTTGITRTPTGVSVFSQQGDPVKFSSSGGKNAWPRDAYLNIWVCNLGSGLLGYAQFPGGAAATDGVVVRYDAFGRVGTLAPGTTLGRTTTHEVGHWLNLRHIWGDNQPFCGNDLVADTPAADGPHYGCQLGVSSCGGLNMSENYMDYTQDSCMNLFTQGQKARMWATLTNGGFRTSLLGSQGCTGGTAPPPPTAPFQQNQPASSLIINGVVSTGQAAAIASAVVNQAVPTAFGSNQGSAGWDVAIGFAPLVASSGGGFQTGGGQKINLDLGAPYVFLNSGTTSALLRPFPGNVTVGLSANAAGTYSLQQFVIAPANPDGVAISQGCQLEVGAGTACALSLSNGPSGDDSSVVVNLLGASCGTPFSFYGTSYSQVHVSSNGRVTFGSADTAYGPSALAARSGVPFAGFWTDLDPSAGGQITLSRPNNARVRVTWTAVRYWGETAAASFSVDLDPSSGTLVLDGLSGIASNPETQSLNVGQNQFLGLSRGAGASDLGTSAFAPGSSGTGPATAMLYDFYNAATTFGGRCPSLGLGLDRLVFVPLATGGYQWTGS